MSVCLQQESAPVKYVTVERTVVGASKPPTAEQLLPIVPRYMPEEMAIWFVDEQINFPNSELVKFAVRPDRWLTFDFSEDN